jgi:hypothetical protein
VLIWTVPARICVERATVKQQKLEPFRFRFRSDPSHVDDAEVLGHAGERRGVRLLTEGRRRGDTAGEEAEASGVRRSPGRRRLGEDVLVQLLATMCSVKKSRR